MDIAERLRLQASRLRSQVTLGWLAEQGGAVVPGMLIVLAAAPSLLPLPGVGNVTGGALLALAISIWRGQRPLALPARVQSWLISPSSASRLLRLLAWLHEWGSRYMKPRASRWVGARALTWAAWPVAMMGVVIFLPIPLGNVFGALALMVLGMGHSLEDGWAVAVGWVLSGLTLLYTVGLTWGLAALGEQVWHGVLRILGPGG
jgi:hypothetical protein